LQSSADAKDHQHNSNRRLALPAFHNWLRSALKTLLHAPGGMLARQLYLLEPWLMIAYQNTRAIL
jgi:hypothetical protein